jgi:HAD superfamily hydrolase (TIGR01484 family)
VDIGLLFDIDGCLTLPDFSRSVLDVSLLDQIFQLYTNGIPVGYITGRSDGWLKEQYTQVERQHFLQIPTYIETGLAFVNPATVTIHPQSTPFLQIRDELIRALDTYIQEQDIYFEADVVYNDYPPHGSLWIENKHVQISLASNTKVTPSEVQELTANALAEYQEQIRILNHHLGVDVIPQDWSKAMATHQFIERIDQSQFEWWVFGDNESDREMMIGLDHTQFFSTQNHASDDVRSILTARGVLPQSSD